MNKRIILGIGSAAAVLVLGAAAVVSGLGITQRTDIEYMTDGPTFADITDLTSASKAVAHVRILSVGARYTIPFDNASPVLTARPIGNPDKDKDGALTSTTPPGAPPSGRTRPACTTPAPTPTVGTTAKPRSWADARYSTRTW